jgi:hypothetical protein
MRVIFVAAASLLAAAPALAQEKSREVVGSDSKVALKTTKTMVDKLISLPQTDEPIDSPMQIWNTDAISKLVICVVGTEGTPVAAPVK